MLILKLPPRNNYIGPACIVHTVYIQCVYIYTNTICDCKEYILQGNKYQIY